MQVTIGATCWDGARRKQLGEEIKIMRFEQSASAELKYIKSIGYFVPLIPLGNLLLAKPAAAHGLNDTAIVAMAVPGAVKEKILHAFDPLVDLAVALSYPIAGVMIAGGCLFIMIGSRDRGMDMLRNAAIGYILVQLSPMFLNLLVGVGSSIS